MAVLSIGIGIALSLKKQTPLNASSQENVIILDDLDNDIIDDVESTNSDTEQAEKKQNLTEDPNATSYDDELASEDDEEEGKEGKPKVAQEKLPEEVWKILADLDRENTQKMSRQDKVRLSVQGLIAIWLILGLAFHLAAVGLIGLSVIILATTFTGVTDEHAIGKSFQESLPFTALLVVFFSIVAVIIDQKLFGPIIHFVLSAEEKTQLALFYGFNGLLSAISDNVFVATVYINEAKNALTAGAIEPHQFELLAVAINTGTNLPSVATPNGQAAFLFLLTSSLAPLIKLSYGRMVYMALPYTIVLTVVGFLAIEFILPDMTIWLANLGLILPI